MLGLSSMNMDIGLTFDLGKGSLVELFAESVISHCHLSNRPPIYWWEIVNQDLVAGMSSGGKHLGRNTITV